MNINKNNQMKLFSTHFRHEKQIDRLTHMLEYVTCHIRNLRQQKDTIVNENERIGQRRPHYLFKSNFN